LIMVSATEILVSGVSWPRKNTEDHGRSGGCGDARSRMACLTRLEAARDHGVGASGPIGGGASRPESGLRPRGARGPASSPTVHPHGAGASRPAWRRPTLGARRPGSDGA
jgi:hypothetical protein